MHPPRPRRPRVPGAILGFITALVLAFPLAVLAGTPTFTDVPESHPFYNDIEAVAAAGVTSGCTATTYCPSQNVTRAQMAAFMNRLGALGPGKTPVANAATSLSTDGFSLGCPSGTVWTSSICLETSNRTADSYFDAMDTCASISGLLGSGPRWRLPLMGELRAARGISGITLDAGGEWADALHVDGGNYFSMTVIDNGSTFQESAAGSTNVFRCAAVPISRDLNLIFIPLGEDLQYPEPADYSAQGVGESGGPLD